MAYTVAIDTINATEAGFASDSAVALAAIERRTPVLAALLAQAHAAVAPAPPVMDSAPELRRLKRIVAYGPRCPDCAGPLVFGEGCHLCPVCGYSACGGGR